MSAPPVPAKQLPRRIPQYQAILDRLLLDIAQGRIAVGARFPTEEMLCARFEVSRYTVREALRRLEDMGLIRRRPRTGSVLATNDIAGRFACSISSMDQLYQYATSTWLDVRGREEVRADGALAAQLGCRRGEVWVRLRAVRRTDATGEPICYTEAYVPAAYGAAVWRVGNEQRRPLYTSIEAMFGVVVGEVVQEITASAHGRAAARALGCRAADPAIMVVRRYLDTAGAPLEIAVNTHPAADFRYVIRMGRERPVRPAGGKRLREGGE